MTIGDTVKLKSGSPVMTIDSIYTDGSTAVCVWFDVIGYLHCQSFNMQALEAQKGPAQ